MTEWRSGPIPDFDLKETLSCGQSFRWREHEDGSFSGVVRGHYARVRTSGGELIAASDADGALWQDYFDLSLDYTAIKAALCELHPMMREAAAFAPGIRILRQEPFEMLISAIISQNNHIKRIEGIVDRLCTAFGEPIGEGVYAFPTAERLALLSREDLAPIRAGFRDRYILDAAQRVADGRLDLENLRGASYAEARQRLMTVAGVGVKVADCVLLFGLHRLEAFPLDVWMKRAMTTLFDGMDPACFGDYAGVAQQYIFHYARMHPERFAG